MAALINIIIIAAAASLTAKKPRPYLCGLGFGLIKATVAYLILSSLLNALINAVLFAVMGTLFFILIDRLAKKPNPANDPGTAYSAAAQKGGGFHWEYIPFVVLALFFLGGEFLLNNLTIVVN